MTTTKIITTGKKLTPKKVNYVSIVDTPATGAPFKILKSTESKYPMIRLDLLQKSTAHVAVVGNAVKAILVAKASLPLYQDQLVASGFDMSNIEDMDGTLVIKQANFNEGEVDAIRMADDLAFFITKSFNPYDSSLDFSEQVKAEGFYPTMYVASEALQDTIRKASREANDPKDMQKRVKQACADFTSYVTGVAAALPSTAFTITKAVAADAAAPAADAAATAAADAPAAAAAPADTAADAAAPAAAADAPAAAPAAAAAAAAPVAAPVAAAAPAAPAAVVEKAAGVTDVAAAVAAALKPQLDNLSESINAVSARVETVEKSTTSIRNVVPTGGDDAVDSNGHKVVPIKKSGGDPFWGGALGGVIPNEIAAVV